MHGLPYIDELAARGQYHFTTEELRVALGVSTIAARAIVRRLKEKGYVASPARGLQVIVPPEYRAMGCLPPDQFVPAMMEYLEQPYYVALLSAAERYGAAHQRPQAFQVVTRRNRPTIECGRVCVAFVARHNVADMPVRNFNTPRGLLRVASPESTAVDLVTYPEHAGGWDNVATVLAELAAMIDGEVLAELALRSADIPVLQRLGYLLEYVEQAELAKPLYMHGRPRIRHSVPLAPGIDETSASYDQRWGLRINTELEIDL